MGRLSKSTRTGARERTELPSAEKVRQRFEERIPGESTQTARSGSVDLVQKRGTLEAVVGGNASTVGVKLPRVQRTRTAAPGPALGRTPLGGERLQHTVEEGWRVLKEDLSKLHHPHDRVGLLLGRFHALWLLPTKSHMGEDFLRALETNLRGLEEATNRLGAPRLGPVARRSLQDFDMRLSRAIDGLKQESISASERHDRVDALAQRFAALSHSPFVRTSEALRSSLNRTYSPATVRQAEPTLTHPVQRTVVLGAGPVGLASAIELLNRGIPVDIVDMRNPWNYTRQNQLALHPVTMNTLGRLGVLEKLADHLVPLEEYVERSDEAPAVHLKVGQQRLAPDAKRASASMAQVSEHFSHSVRIAHLEAALFERVIELGAVPIANGQAELVAAGGGRQKVMVHKGQQVDGTFQRSGETRDLGVPSLVVDATGPRSPLREAFGVAWRGEENPISRLIAGRIEGGSDTAVFRHMATEAGQTVRSVVFGARNESWALVEVPADRNFSTPEATEAYFRSRVSAATEGAAKEGVLLAGGREIFEVQNRASETSVWSSAENQLVIAVGDAKGVGTPMVGRGAQTGIVGDRHNVGRLADNLERGMSWNASAELFDLFSRQNIQSWWRHGEPEFITDRGRYLDAKRSVWERHRKLNPHSR